MAGATSVPDKHRDHHIQTLLYPKDLEASLRAVSSAARTAIEESGVNMLYVAFGFLEWSESEHSERSFLAPLILLPVTLERGRVDLATGTYVYEISYSGEDPTTNLSLREKLAHDFGLVMPELLENEPPEAYFARFRQILTQKPCWRLRRYISMSLFHFGRLLLYLDLDPARWPSGAPLAEHPLIKMFFEGNPEEPSFAAEEYDLDLDPEKAAKAPIVLDADSSQHSALIDALEGKNLVIEGPPGTGKSQTITNLIAGALATGKTVLFVSEKLAALEVVRRRLNEAGLGNFCLELHSHRTQKRSLLDDIERRMRMQERLRAPGQFEQRARLLASARERLAAHAALMRQPFGQTGMTIQEVLCAATRYRIALGPLCAHVEGALEVAQSDCDTEWMEHNERVLEVFARAYRRAIGSRGSPHTHPWAGLCSGELQPFDWQRLAVLLKAWKLEGESLQAAIKVISVVVEVDLPETIQEAQRLVRLNSELAEPEAGTRFDLLPRLRDEAAVLCLKRTVAAIDGARDAMAKLDAWFEEPRKTDASLALSGSVRIEGLCQTIESELSIHELTRVAKLVARLKELIESLAPQIQQVSGCVGQPIPLSRTGLNALLELLRLSVSAPTEMLLVRGPLFEDPGFAEALARTETETKIILRTRAQLASRLDLQTSVPAPDLRSAASVLRAAGWLRWFSKEWRMATQVYATLVHTPSLKERRSDSQRADDLMRLSDCIERTSSLARDESLRRILGQCFAGTETDFNGIRRLKDWHDQVRSRLGDGTGSSIALADALLRLPASDIAALRRVESGPVPSMIAELLTAIDESTKDAPGLLRDHDDLLASRDHLASTRDEIGEVVDLLKQAGTRRDLSLGAAGIGFEMLRQADSACDAIEHDAAAREIVGDSFDGARTDTVALKSTLAFVEALSVVAIHEDLISWMCRKGRREAFEDLRDQLAIVARALKAYTTAEETFARTTDLDSAVWLNGALEPLQLDTVVMRANKALSGVSEFTDWLDYRQATASCQHLRSLVGSVEDGVLPPDRLRDAHRFCVYTSLARAIVRQHSELQAFQGTERDVLRERFAVLDEEVMSLQRERIRHQAGQRPVPWGNSSGPVSSLTDRALLVHEIEKKKRHLPIRQLVRRAGRALLALKPCFMMGPLSAAQYLEPGALTFDLLVMDEASQIRPEDALGAVARAKQVVVVGDPNQLPPTSFFERMFGDDLDGEEETSQAEDSESILDAAAALFRPMRRLRWHYRSQHESLIAFSNLHFYKRDLIVFPSAIGSGGRLGVRFVKVPRAIYGRSMNPGEARAIAAAVIDHMVTRKGESLGVVAMNKDQADLVWDEVERLMKSEPAAEAYYRARLDGPEPFFVKNLENVQGDERDVIFISVTFGPNEAGHVVRNFGPINRPDGWRRLNVLFTRAKKRVVVFSSMSAGDIAVDPGMASGSKALRDYLAYAEEGVLSQPEFTGREPGSDFEIAVAQALAARGYECAAQLGVAGYYLDIAVKHPDRPGSYILGVECDGASYHSARSVRDRDRLRQSILEKLGWHIHRVWSTDWFKSHEREVERLVARLNDLRRTAVHDIKAVPMAAPFEQSLPGRAVGNESPTIGRSRATRRDSIQPLLTAEEARALLVQLREEQLIPAFPDVDRSAGLLRKAMLEVLLRDRPTTAEEFQERTPSHLSSQTDDAQLRIFGERVFAILARIANGKSPSEAHFGR